MQVLNFKTIWMVMITLIEGFRASKTQTSDNNPSPTPTLAPRFVGRSTQRSFIVWPASHTAIRLRCQATGAKPIKYRWLKDGKKIRPRRLDPYMNVALWYLKLKDPLPRDDGKYTCIVSNKYGSINHTYTLLVVARPRTPPILKSSLPRNTTVKLRQKAVLRCVAVVSGTHPDFRWLKWHKIPKMYKNVSLYKLAKSQATAVSPIHYRAMKVRKGYGVKLIITKVTKKDLGMYTCCASNHIGMKCNSAFLVEKEIPSKKLLSTNNRRSPPQILAPQFVDWSKMQRSFIAWPVGHTIRLRCQATGAKPIKYRWIKNGKKLKRRRLDPYMNDTLWYLKLKDLVPSDNGKYTCIVSNKYGSINHTYTLHVVAKPRSPPIFLPQVPKNTTVDLGENAELRCIIVVSGTLPDFRWLKWKKAPKSLPKVSISEHDKSKVDLINPIHYNTIKAGEHFGVKLTIPNVTEKDLGMYTCCASNHIGMRCNSAFLVKKEITTTKPFPTSNWTFTGTTITDVIELKASKTKDKQQPSLNELVLIAVLGGFFLVFLGFAMFLYFFFKTKFAKTQIVY